MTKFAELISQGMDRVGLHVLFAVRWHSLKRVLIFMR